MRIIKEILKYGFMIFVTVIVLFGLKMILPVSDNSTNNSVNKNIVYDNKA